MTEPKPWLSLPDEEPPARGLDELMAAARRKADVMATMPRPRPWGRIVGLVLATGGLVGGALALRSCL
jgi:hypothetical protein